MKLYVFDPHTHEFKDSRDAQKDIHGHPITDVLFATPVAPPDVPHGHAARWTGSAWEVVEDHRQHINSQGVKEGGTQYWLPGEGDNWQSQGRYMTELGPLPAGAVTSRPEKPEEEKLADAKATKTAESDRAMADVDVALVRSTSDLVAAMLSPAALTAEEGGASNLNADELAQSRTVFDKLRGVQAQNRVLRAQVEAAETVEEVQAVEPVIPDMAALAAME